MSEEEMKTSSEEVVVEQAPAKKKCKLDTFFGVSKRGSTIRTEIVAGIVTFLAILELMKVGKIFISQENLFDDIKIESKIVA